MSGGCLTNYFRIMPLSEAHFNELNSIDINIMNKIKNKEVEKVFSHFPKEIREKLMTLRQLIIKTGGELKEVAPIEETLKWGEPSYLIKGGSTIRINWKKSTPDQYAIYFNCKTKLVDTFKERYKDEFKYEGNRAIVFKLNDTIPINELKHCILLALTYHSIKNLPMLGI